MHALSKIGENNNHNIIVNLLIDNGADINLKHKGNTSLHMAIEGESNIKFIEKLISAGFDVNSINELHSLHLIIFSLKAFYFFIYQY